MLLECFVHLTQFLTLLNFERWIAGQVCQKWEKICLKLYLKIIVVWISKIKEERFPMSFNSCVEEDIPQGVACDSAVQSICWMVHLHICITLVPHWYVKNRFYVLSWHAYIYFLIMLGYSNLLELGKNSASLYISTQE